MGAHMIAIKDMAGLCRPYAAQALVKALKDEIGLPIHFHTHDTSGVNAGSVLRASDAGVDIADLRVDGGASVMDEMLQMQADQLGVPVRRPTDQETTALGAAYLAGLAEGVWPTLQAIADEWSVDAVFEPNPERLFTDLAHDAWLRAVDRSRNWIKG